MSVDFGMDRRAPSSGEGSGVRALPGDLYERLVEASPDAILLIDPRGTILLANERAHCLWQVAAGGLERRRLQDLVEPVDGLAVEQKLLDAIRWDDVIGVDLVLRRNDGVAVAVELNASPAEGVMGCARAVMCTLRDVTTRRQTDLSKRTQAERSLGESEGRHRSLFETMTQGVVYVDASGAITAANPAAAAILGRPLEDLRGRSLVDERRHAIRPGGTDVPEQASPITEALRSGKPVTDVVMRLFNPVLSDTVWIDVSAVPQFRPGEETPCEVFATFSDVSRLREAEKSLASSEERFRLLSERAPDLIYRFVARPSRGFEYVSPACWELTGHAPEEFYDDWRLAFRMLHRDDRKTVVAALRDGAIDSEPLTLRLTRKDGQTAWVEHCGSSVLDDEGRVIARHAIARDITRRVCAEAELRSSLARLDATLKGTVRALGAVAEKRDPYTAGHQRRVALIAGAIAERLGFSPDRAEGVRIASLLHDIGKVAVPIEILSKPGIITEHEAEIIRLHPGVAHGILSSVDFPWPVAEVALQHHERLDGSGYPQHLRGEETLLESRIVAVADVVEAMSSHRPYRPAHSVHDALAEVKRGRGVLFDPDVVDACVELFEDEAFMEGLA